MTLATDTSNGIIRVSRQILTALSVKKHYNRAYKFCSKCVDLDCLMFVVQSPLGLELLLQHKAVPIFTRKAILISRGTLILLLAMLGFSKDTITAISSAGKHSHPYADTHKHFLFRSHNNQTGVRTPR